MCRDLDEGQQIATSSTWEQQVVLQSSRLLLKLWVDRRTVTSAWIWTEMRFPLRTAALKVLNLNHFLFQNYWQSAFEFLADTSAYWKRAQKAHGRLEFYRMEHIPQDPWQTLWQILLLHMEHRCTLWRSNPASWNTHTWLSPSHRCTWKASLVAGCHPRQLWYWYSGQVWEDHHGADSTRLSLLHHLHYDLQSINSFSRRYWVSWTQHGKFLKASTVSLSGGLSLEGSLQEMHMILKPEQDAGVHLLVSKARLERWKTQSERITAPFYISASQAWTSLIETMRMTCLTKA